MTQGWSPKWLVSELLEGETREPGSAEDVSPARRMDEGRYRHPLPSLQCGPALQKRGTCMLVVQEMF